VEDAAYKHVTVDQSVTFLDEETVALRTWLNPRGNRQRQSFTRTVISRITCSVSPTTTRYKFNAEVCDPFSKFVSVGGSECDAAEDVEPEAESAQRNVPHQWPFLSQQERNNLS